MLKDTAVNAGPAGREKEFTGEELKELQRKMHEEFGMPVAAARTADATVPGWPLLLLPALASASLLRRKRAA